MTAPDQASPTGQDTPPTCYRHPGRETWVSCVRCGRHACPDCLRDAAVGQQCVDCVRGAGQGGQGARAARTVFGGRPSRSATRDLDPDRRSTSCCSSSSWRRPEPRLRLVDARVRAGHTGRPGPGVAAGEWYRLITSAFLRRERASAASGSWTSRSTCGRCIVVGPDLERLLGRVRFLAVYLLSAVGGSVLYYYLVPISAGRSARRARSSACSAPGSWSPAAPPRQPGDRPADRASTWDSASSTTARSPGRTISVG